uniref:G-protein coupled receptors family 1 profile domain-containing protein n=1 Tax=Chelydra serpentina TaxID=8475 RepID=A0A8C3SAL9_CHESE
QGPNSLAVGLILTFIDLITLFGNTVVFICPVVEKRLRTATYMFIMSLAMADLLVACLVMPFSIIYEVTGMWLFGKLFCKVWISFDVMFCTASIVTLCFISLDRYCSVVTPYHYSMRMSRRRCIIMTCMVWVYSSLISFLPVMQGWNEIPGVDFDAGKECIFVTNWTFAIVASALAFFVPFMIMCSMYFFIYRASRLKATRIMSQSLEIHYHPNSKRQNNLQLENKATRTISIIISVFILCWLPYFVLNVWLAAKGTNSTSAVLVDAFKIITWLGYCNSTINPMLYAFLNRDFQRALKKLFICSDGLCFSHKESCHLMYKWNSLCPRPLEGCPTKYNCWPKQVWKPLSFYRTCKAPVVQDVLSGLQFSKKSCTEHWRGR